MSEQEPVLQIKIDNKQNLDLRDFNKAVKSLENQYYSYLERSDIPEAKTNRLYIKEVGKGSIIIELCEQASALSPAMTPCIIAFTRHLIDVMSYLSGKKKQNKHELSKKDINDFKNIFQLSANKNGNSTSFTGLNFGTFAVNNSYDSNESVAGHNECSKMIKQIKKIEGDKFIKEKVELDFYLASNSNLSKVGKMGIINEVSDTPKVLSYANDRLRYDLTKAEDNPLSFKYTVDIEVKLKDGRNNYDNHLDIKEYEILKLHGVISKEDISEN